LRFPQPSKGKTRRLKGSFVSEVSRANLHYILGFKHLKEGDNFEGLDVYGIIIFTPILKKYDESMDWIHLVQFWDQLPSLVNMIMNLLIP
jgi:hypothetical protein